MRIQVGEHSIFATVQKHQELLFDVGVRAEPTFKPTMGITTHYRMGKTQKRIGITRVHMEEDAGKSLHEGFPDSDRKSYIDLNRSGVPLIEIVSEPDLRTPDEAYEYLTRLKTILSYLAVSNCNMEEGSLRCDANVSVRPAGASAFGVKMEVKNLNSFRFLHKALAYEIERQIEIVDKGGTIHQETRLWDSREQRTYGMRSKEFAHDYRYFPEPDLLPLVITEEWKEEVRRELPELPDARRQRFIREYALPEYDAGQLILSKDLAEYFEKVAKASGEPKLAANWVLSELLYLLKEANKEITESPVSAEHLAELLAMIQKGAVSGKMAKDILAEMFSTGKTAAQVVSEKGLTQISDTGRIAEVVREIMAANPKQVEQYRSGKSATLAWFVGQVMKSTRGQANPQVVQETLKKELG